MKHTKVMLNNVLSEKQNRDKIKYKNIEMVLDHLLQFGQTISLNITCKNGIQVVCLGICACTIDNRDLQKSKFKSPISKKVKAINDLEGS